MRIQRFYTVHGEDAYARIRLKTVTITKPDASDEPACVAMTVPAAWSYTAALAWHEHACYHGSIPSRTLPVAEAKTPEWLFRREAPAGQLSGSAQETDCRQVFDRVAGGLAYCGWKNGYFTVSEDAQTFYDELRYLLANGMATLPGSVLRHAGVHWAYGVTTAASGNFGLERGQRVRRAALSPDLLGQSDPHTAPECFRLDDQRFAVWLEGKRDAAAANLALRWGSLALQEQLDGIYAAAVNGSAAPAVDKARRLGVPDVLIAPVLDRAGRRAGRLAIEVQGEDAGGARANERLSVFRLPEDETLYRSMWSYNAPAVHFAQTWQDWDMEAEAAGVPATHCAGQHGAKASHGSLNLYAFLSEHQAGWAFDTVGLTHASKVLTLALDLVLQATGYPDEGSAQRSQATRSLALGYHNLAPCLLALGHAYDSDSARALAAAVTACIAGNATLMSAELAQQLGAAGDHERQRKVALRVLRNRRRAAYGETQDYEALAQMPAGINLDQCPDLVLLAAARRAWDNALALAQAAGLRNLRLTSLDTDSVQRDLLEATTAGLQPLPALTQDRQESEEQFSRQLVPGFDAALTALGYNESEQKMIRGQLVGTRTLRGAPYINHETLAQKGLSPTMLERLESALATAGSILHAAHPWVLGEAICGDLFNLGAAELDDPHFNLLQRLGYGAAEIAAANAYACGGIPADQIIGIQPKHRPILACLDAVGEGALSPVALLRMAGAVQPFISGDVALTVPLSANSEADDVAALAQLAQDYGCKSFAIERAAEPPLPRSLEAVVVRNVLRQNDNPADPNARRAPHQAGNASLRAALPTRRRPDAEAVAAARLKVRISAAEGTMPEAIN